MNNNDNKISFSNPGFAQPDRNNTSQNTTPDFASMSKKELKAYDAKYGSYKRILGDKPITWLWLMNHYSVANAAAYKAQQKKNKNSVDADKMNTPVTGNSGNNQGGYQNPENQNRGYQNFGGQNGSFQNGGYQNFESLNGGFQNGGYQNFGSQNGGFQNGGYQNMGNQNGGYQNPENQNRGYQYSDIEPGDRTTKMDPKLLQTLYRIPAALYCVAFNQEVEITKIPFIIGRSRQDIDLCIPDNKNLGRRHAEITFMDGSYYIEDLNSVNHVFVNGRKIEANIPYRLKSNDKLMLGNEELIFRLED